MSSFNSSNVKQYVLDMTGMIFEEAISRYWVDVMLTTTDDSDLASFEKADPAMFVETIHELIDIVNENKNLLHSPVITDALKYSYERAQLDSRVRKDKWTDLTNILFRKEELIAWLKRLWIHCFNPMVQLNNPQVRFVKSVLRFKSNPTRYCSWVQPQYRTFNDTHIKYYIVDTSQITNWELDKLYPHLYIWEDVKVYHPVVWKYIIDWNTNALLINTENYGWEEKQSIISEDI